MSAFPGSIELIDTDVSRFDELDVARCVAKLGGSMRGRHAVFTNPSRLVAAMDVLSERYGARYFAPLMGDHQSVEHCVEETSYAG